MVEEPGPGAGSGGAGSPGGGRSGGPGGAGSGGARRAEGAAADAPGAGESPSSSDGDGPEDHRAAIQRRARTATLYAGGFLLVAVAVAVLGGAVLALLLWVTTGTGFLVTWLVVTLLILGVPVVGQLLVAAWRRLRGS